MARKLSSKRHIRDLLESSFLVLVSFTIVFALIKIRQEMKIDAKNFIETSWVVLALLPPLMWLIVTGRLQEFAVGSLTVKLATAAAQPIEKLFGRSGIKHHIIRGIIPSDPEGGLGETIIERPAILTLELGNDAYTDAGIKTWTQRLLQAGSLRWVAFVDLEGRLQKYVRPSSLLVYLARKGEKIENNEMSRQIANCQIPSKIPDLRTDRLQNNATNGQAMAYLAENQLNEVAVIDGHGRLTDLLHKSDIVADYVYLIIRGEDGL